MSSRLVGVLAVVLLVVLPGCLTEPERGEDRGIGEVGGAFSLGPAVPVPNLEGTHAAEPSIAARETEAGVVLVAASFEYVAGSDPAADTRFHIVLHRSLDEGVTWESARLPEDLFAREDPAGLLTYSGDPVLAYAPDGALYLVGVAAHGVWKEGPLGFPLVTQISQLSLFVTRSEDDGRSWSPPLLFRQGTGTFGFPVLAAGILEDKPWIAVGPDGVIHVTFTEFLETQSVIRYTRSEDRGASWSEPAALALSKPGFGEEGPLAGQQPLQASTVSAPGGNRVYVSATEYPADQDPNGGVIAGGHQLAWVSADNGVTFEGPIPVGPASNGRYGTIFADPSRPERVFVTAAEDKEESGVYLVGSTDGGASWSEPLWLGANRTGTKLHPTGWVDASGRPRLVWYDMGFPDGEHVAFAVVENGTVRYDGSPVGEPGAPGFARREYMGIAGVGKAAWAAWIGGTAEAGTRVEVARLTG